MDNHSDFTDRKGLLVFFGVVKLFFGAVSFLFFLLVLFAVLAVKNADIEGAQQLTAGSALPGAFMYLFLAAVFIILGIGSIKKTRWARSLTLLFSWFTFIAGIVTTVIMAFFVNSIFNNADPALSDNPGLLLFVKLFMFIFLIFFLVIIPGIFILVYKSRNVIKTVQKYDPKVRWTDRCPLPLLALSFIWLYICICPLFMISTGFVVPFFGTFLTGLPAAFLLCINSVICIYLAINIYKLNIRSWYYSLYLCLFWTASFIITLIFNDYMEIYKHMNIPPDQLRAIENMGLLTNNNILLMSVSSIVLWLVFLFYTKKFFDNTLQYDRNIEH